jgi:glycosyltransferase involved in cell wall biosynthesis
MRIGLDARFYGREAKGLGRYTERLLTHLGQLKTDHEFVVFLRKENFDTFDSPAPNFRKVIADVPWYSWQEQVQLPRLLGHERLDLMHFLHFNAPLLYRQPMVVTIHDLILLHFPTRRASTRSAPIYWAKHALYHAVLASAVHRARHVLTVSEFSRSDLIRTFGLSPNDVTVTYEAADPIAGMPKSPSGVDLNDRGFYLYVGNAYPHKNLEWLLTTLAGEWKSGREPLPLVAVGRRDYFFDRLVDLAGRLGVSKWVYWLGSVDDATLKWLYQNASAYLFPSRYEGFGLPGLEAMGEGLPVIAARASSLPEVYADAALYFDPLSGPSLVHALGLLRSDSRVRDRLIHAGRDRVAQFSWHRLAEQTLETYNRCRP